MSFGSLEGPLSSMNIMGYLTCQRTPYLNHTSRNMPDGTSANDVFLSKRNSQYLRAPLSSYLFIQYQSKDVGFNIASHNLHFEIK